MVVIWSTDRITGGRRTRPEWQQGDSQQCNDDRRESHPRHTTRHNSRPSSASVYAFVAILSSGSSKRARNDKITRVSKIWQGDGMQRERCGGEAA